MNMVTDSPSQPMTSYNRNGDRKIDVKILSIRPDPDPYPLTCSGGR